ncbi:MAG: potassium transporter Kup [Verrucomicrobiales bacterium]|nr:potassium transporter Kup [Verrucomicrobiales bacterium]
MNPPPSRRRSAQLALGALGVVYGDIGTSPLYAFRECIRDATTPPAILGAASLIVWSLVLLVSVKYLVFVLRADNHGEGGILALMALATSKAGANAPLLAFTGILGASLLYGDGIITPAITVLGAIEGLQVAWPSTHVLVVPATLVVVVCLFAVQHHGAGRVGSVFGPIMLVWFSTLALLGIVAILRRPDVLQALHPSNALRFLSGGGWHAIAVLGSVFLAVTGAEALYADLGHFGTRPIRIAWSTVVFPSLTLNYLGQAALLLDDPTAAANPFFRLAPPHLLVPLVLLSTSAGIVASQALISGAFSLTMQAMQLGYLPRINIDHTSADHRGQIYIGVINTALALGCAALVLGFRSSAALAAAYGIAVALTMVITTLLLAQVARTHWNWSPARILAFLGSFLILDLAFLGANLIKFLDGGWLPLALAAVLVTLMLTWHRGRGVVGRRLRSRLVGLDDFIAQVAQDPQVRRVRGTAVFLASNPEGTPIALAQNIKHNRVLHERVVILSFQTSPLPHVPVERRVTVQPLAHGFWRVVAHFGFMEDPEIGPARETCAHTGLSWTDFETTYFLGRESIVQSRHPILSRWRLALFGLLSRNAQEPAAFFRLPANRVVELGVQVEL